MRMGVATHFLLRKYLRKISNQGIWQFHPGKCQSPALRRDRGAWACLATMRSPLAAPRTRMAVPSQQHRPPALVITCLDCHVWERTNAGLRQGSSGTRDPICPAQDRPGEHGHHGQPMGTVGPTGHGGHWVGSQFLFPKEHGGWWLFSSWRRWWRCVPFPSFQDIRLWDVRGRHIRIKKSRDLDPKSTTDI